MPWKVCDAMDERKRFVEDWALEIWSFSELCDRYGVSRPTGYKWIDRFEQEGEVGLCDRSRRPHYCPQATPDTVITSLLDARRLHPTWGGKKIAHFLKRRNPALAIPAPATIDTILKKHGLVRARRRRQRPGHPGRPMIVPEEPNDLWTVDFKGEFRLGNGLYCYPLTIADYFSRYLLECKGLLSIRHVGVQPVFEKLFRTHGLPRAIRSDNGVPFATIGLARLSRLSVWWIKLGIHPELIQPGCPAQNGVHERMHRTLKDRTTRPPAYSMRAQQNRFALFMEEFNLQRPHESLGMATPSDLYDTSPRLFPAKIPKPEYPGHFLTRRVSNSDSFRWKHQAIQIGSALEGEHIGIEESGDGIWSIYFYKYLLAILDERLGKIQPIPSGLQRNLAPPHIPRYGHQHESIKNP